MNLEYLQPTKILQKQWFLSQSFIKRRISLKQSIIENVFISTFLFRTTYVIILRIAAVASWNILYMLNVLYIYLYLFKVDSALIGVIKHEIQRSEIKFIFSPSSHFNLSAIYSHGFNSTATYFKNMQSSNSKIYLISVSYKKTCLRFFSEISLYGLRYLLQIPLQYFPPL